MADRSLQRAVAQAYGSLVRSGLCVGSAGNVSLAVDGRMLITRSGATGTLTEADVVYCDFDGQCSEAFAPSSEWEMHAAIYRAAPHAKAVVHTHSDACTALASLGEGLPPFHYMVLGFGGADVRCAPYETFGSSALASAAACAIEDRTACLLANHGMICHGRDLAAAVATAERLETLARQYLLAAAIRPPKLLTASQVAAARERYRTYGSPTRKVAAPPPE